MEIDTWVDAAGKNGMRRDWLIRDCSTKETIARATRYFSPYHHHHHNLHN